MSLNSGKNVEKEVASVGNVIPKKRGRKPGQKNKKSIIVSNQKEITKKRTIKNICLKSNSVSEEKTKPLATSNKKIKRTLHLNLSNFTNDNAEITDTTKEKNSDNIGVICDAVKTDVEANNFNDVDNLIDSYDLVVDDDVLFDDTINDGNNIIENSDNSIKEAIVENNDNSIEEAMAKNGGNSDIESVSKILRNVSNSHGPDNSINQNSPFFYGPSVFDKFDIDITYTDSSEEDNGAIINDVQGNYEQGFDSDDNFEITRIEFNVGNYVGDDEEENNVNDENNLNAENEDFDIIGGVIEPLEESNTANNEEENDEFDFVSYDKYDIYSSQENNAEDLSDVDNLENNNSNNNHYSLDDLDEIYDLNYLDIPNDVSNFSNENIGEESNVQENLVGNEISASLDNLDSVNLEDLLTLNDLDNLAKSDSSDNSKMLDNPDDLNALDNLDDLINLDDLADFIANGSLDDVSKDDVPKDAETENKNNEADSNDENSKETNTSIPEGSVQLENDENSEKISNITYKLLNKILEVESEIKKEAADSPNGSSVFKEFSFDDTSSAISSAIQSKEFQNELEKIILGQDVKSTTFAEPKLNSAEGATPISNLETTQMVQENIAPAETILGENSNGNNQNYDVDYSQVLTPSADVQDSGSTSSEELKDDEYDDSNFSIEKYFGISKISTDYDDSNDDDNALKEEDLVEGLEGTTLDDVLLEKIYEEDLNKVDSSDSSNKSDDPASDLLAITESLSQAISDLENTPDTSSSHDSLLEEDNKSFNILINKDDIFSVYILNETYDIVTDFDGISIISENIHISTPKNNFFVKAGEYKYIEIHNNKDHFDVYTNFENIDFANAINNVEFAKKDNRLELKIKEAFKLSSVKNKIHLSMLNTVIADMTSSVPSPDNIDENSICDNRTLLISEETQKVYLPYTLEEVMQKLDNNFEYKTAKEVIDKEYTLPLSTFRFPILSRFKEAYRFMRLKEKSSIYAAIDLALELMFNSNLNPAIIRACKDLKELNIYLDCLYENELEKFDCFKVVYKVLPKVK